MKTLQLIFILLSFLPIQCFAKSGSEIIKEHGFKSSVAPLLLTQWSQDGGENSHLPLVNGKLAKTGCGVTATAQVMRFWEFPTYGIGANYYIWDNPQGERIVLYANFQESHYDWDNMIPKYKNNPTATDIEINAVSKLMSDLGIALEVKYKDNSTATNIEYISTVLKKYFGYNPNMTIHRYINGVYTMDEWLTMIYSELSEGRPIIMGGAYKGANHIYIADGYDSNGFVHLNLGKASVGSSCNKDGYYDLSITGQTYNEDMRMLIGICPNILPYDIPEYTISTPGTIKNILGGDIHSKKLCMIKIRGNINDSDISVLKELSSETTGQLSYIDISEAKITTNTIPSNAFDNCYTLQEIRLPNTLTGIGSSAFRNCVGLWKIEMPESLSTLNNYSFSNCRYLSEVNLPNSLSKIYTNPFRYEKLSSFSISKDNPDFIISNGALLNDTKDQLYSMPLLTIGRYRIEDGIKAIRGFAFTKQCMIDSLIIPKSTSQIGPYAFLECIGLKHIFILNENPPILENTSFDSNIYGDCIIHIPEGCKDTYSNSNWNVFNNIVEDKVCSSINNITNDCLNSTTEIYNLQGQKVVNCKSGNIYIIRSGNGPTRKIRYNE